MAKPSETLNNALLLAKIIVALVLAVAIGTGAVIGWRWYNDHNVSVDKDGVVRAQVIRATLFERGDLRVGRLSGVVQGRAQTSRLWGWLTASQVVKAPFTVDYFVDLGKITSDNIQLSRDGSRLLVTAPDVSTDKPNVDMADATLNDVHGWFVSRSATAELAQKAAASARTVAAERARRPENMSRTREFARSAIQRFLTNALRAAKVDAEIEVRFAGEARPQDGGRWDVSRSLAEVLGNGA